jgi:Bacterial Ig-like domain (group 1)
MRRGRFRKLVAPLVLAILALAVQLPGASAASGDLVGSVNFSVDCTNASDLGVGIAYDGTNLWYSCVDQGTDLYRANPKTGAVSASYNIAGGLGALSYDATRNVLWAGKGNFSEAGEPVREITLNAAKDVVGSSVAFTIPGDCMVDDGLAFDARNVLNPADDVLYYSNDCNTTIIRAFDLSGALVESFPWGGTSCYNSGLAIGGQLLYQGSDGCSHVWVVDKTTKAAAFDFSTVVPADPNFRDEDLECDPDTFAALGKQVMWSKEAYNPQRAHAFEIPVNTCGAGGVAPPAKLTLAPKTATNQVGSQHCVTATVTDVFNLPVPAVTVPFSVTGANSGGGSDDTDANGEATFCYTGTVAGNDTIAAYADTNKSGTHDPGEPSDTAAKTWTPGPPATLVLAPKTATNTVDAQHCVTATVKDQYGNPTPGITVRFSVTGSVSQSGAVTTDANGKAKFCYTGPALPGSDVITAYADTSNNNVQDPGEPSDTAAKTWVLPESTPGCKVTNGGRITAANGDKATFGGNAMVPASGPKGQEQYRDHGAAANLNVHSINVLAVTCSADGKSASIFGTTKINGAGSFNYRIDVTDNGEPGTGVDTYRLRLSTGYDSGVQTLSGGNIQIH